jgi:hypothetical protein
VSEYGSAGKLLASVTTDATGTYAFYSAPGSYRVGFAASGYTAQFYNGKPSLATADVVTVPDAGGCYIFGPIVPGINAAMAPPASSPTTTPPPTTTAPASVTPPPAATPPQAATAPRLAISDVSQSHRRWRRTGGSPRVARVHRPPFGTTFRFALNEAATVRFAFAQLLPGRKVNGKCVAQSARNRSHKACTRSVPRGSLSFSAGAGPHKLFFQGRLTPTTTLKPGTYRLTITATNAAGQRATKALRSFTIVPG